MPLFREHLVPWARQFPDCPCCGRDLTGLAEQAIFCPSCGQRLRMTITTKDRIISRAASALHYISLGKLGHLKQEPDTDPGVCCTPILVGYSKAMFTLGWRYERGGGATRNLPEAIRCYRKSARLGNLDAMVRLAPGEAEPAKRVLPIEERGHW